MRNNKTEDDIIISPNVNDIRSHFSEKKKNKFDEYLSSSYDEIIKRNLQIKASSFEGKLYEELKSILRSEYKITEEREIHNLYFIVYICRNRISYFKYFKKQSLAHKEFIRQQKLCYTWFKNFSNDKKDLVSGITIHARPQNLVIREKYYKELFMDYIYEKFKDETSEFTQPPLREMKTLPRKGTFRDLIKRVLKYLQASNYYNTTLEQRKLVVWIMFFSGWEFHLRSEKSHHTEKIKYPDNTIQEVQSELPRLCKQVQTDLTR